MKRKVKEVVIKEVVINSSYIKNIDFYYGGVDITYDRIDNGTDKYDSIANEKVVSLDTEKITDKILSRLNTTNEVNRYCIDRVVSRLNNDSFYVDVKGGYYGQEINGVFISDSDVIEIILKIYKETDINEKIRMVLENEYGYLLPSLKMCKFISAKVPVACIEVGNEDHYKKLDINTVNKYKKIINDDLENKNNDRIFGICRCFNKGMSDEMFKLVDGYHRFYALNFNKVKSAKYIVFE